MMDNTSKHDYQTLWKQFESEFPTEASSFGEICMRVKGSPFQCPFCINGMVTVDCLSRTSRCDKCKKIVWLTSKTFFHRIRKPRAWHAAIYLLENGAQFNANQFHKIAGVSIATASTIFKKVMHLLNKEMVEIGSLVSSEVFIDIFCKRSRETPAGEHPKAEELALRQTVNPAVGDAPDTGAEIRLDTQAADCIHDMTDNSLSSFASRFDSEQVSQQVEQSAKNLPAETLEANEIKVLSAVSVEPISFDQLCLTTNLSAAEASSALVILELNGLVISLPGDRVMRSVSSEHQAPELRRNFCGSEEMKSKVAGILSFLATSFGSISRKYLQYYLSFSWFHADKSSWKSGYLWRLCAASEPVRWIEIMSFVSPAQIKVA